MSEATGEYRDRLSVLGIRLRGRHGALDEEREVAQRFEVDVVLHADLAAAGRTDDLSATADYRSVVEAARAVVEGEGVTLIETLATTIGERVLSETKPSVVGAVEVRVRKPDARLDATVETVEAAVVLGRR